MKITKRTVDVLEPGDQITDSEVRGFRARCLPSGAITFSFRYRNAAGKRHELPLGLHGTITAEQARSPAQQHAPARSPAAAILPPSARSRPRARSTRSTPCSTSGSSFCAATASAASTTSPACSITMSGR